MPFLSGRGRAKISLVTTETVGFGPFGAVAAAAAIALLREEICSETAGGTESS
jgi:hypothetical protein